MKLNDKLKCTRYKGKGFTTFELLVSISILGILAAVAIPAIGNYTEKRRLIGAAEAIYSQLQWARSEALKQSREITIDFRQSGTFSNPIEWHAGVSDTGSCTPNSSNSCMVSGAEQVIHSADFPGVSMSQNFSDGQTNFEPERGTASPSGALTFTTATYDLRVIVAPIGRIKICSPTVGHVNGYPTNPVVCP